MERTLPRAADPPQGDRIVGEVLLAGVDGVAFRTSHASPGETRVTRLDDEVPGLITCQELVLAPADWDPTCGWWMDGRTRELVNIHAARAFMTRNWPQAGAALSLGGVDVTRRGRFYRWEVWGPSGHLIDLVRTPVAGWTKKILTAELRAAGWWCSAGAADPFTNHKQLRDYSGATPVRVLPDKPFRWMFPALPGTRQWPVGMDTVATAVSACRTLTWPALRAITHLQCTDPEDPARPRTEAALVGVIDRHLTRPLAPVPGRPASLCSCAAQPFLDSSPASGHLPCCACHEPHLLTNAALRRYTELWEDPFHA